MDTLKQLRDELSQKYETTKAFFEIYPDDKNDYKPHEKSRSMIHLATHIAEIFGWRVLCFGLVILTFPMAR